MAKGMRAEFDKRLAKLVVDNPFDGIGKDEKEELDALHSEAQRSSGPKWERLAFLALVARVHYGESMARFVVGAQLKATGGATMVHRWIRAYEVRRAVPPKERRGIWQLSYYESAANHPKYRAGEWTALQAFKHAVKAHGGYNLLYAYLKGQTSAARILAADPAMAELFTPATVAQYMADSAKVRDALKEMATARKKAG